MTLKFWQSEAAILLEMEGNDASLRSIFVAYLLDCSSLFAELPKISRTQIAFLFELYIYKDTYSATNFVAQPSACSPVLAMLSLY